MNVSEIARIVRTMRHSPVRNYALPGLTSQLVGGDGHGRVRMFEADRDTRELIAPHSHRFDFACLVLAGTIENTRYEPAIVAGEAWAVGTLRPGAEIGTYQFEPGATPRSFTCETTLYGTGSTYSMRAREIHSIRFSRGAAVLFFEGPQVYEWSVVLEPWADGARVPTFEVRPWMFQRDGGAA